MTNPRFTVLIPTRDRCETLHSTIATCLDQNYDNLRVVVSDNVSTDRTADVVASFDDPRLSCIRPDRRLSMSGNFEFSLASVTEGFVMHLGDDDGLIPGGVEVAASIIAETGCEAVTSSHAVYHWPNSLFEPRRNVLTLRVARGFDVRDAREYCTKVANFDLNYTELPGTYVSFVRTDLIERARRSGRYYRSITPDCYSGFLNAAHLDRYAFSKRPFTVSGISGRSNGASHAVGTDPTEALQYQAENDFDIHPEVVNCLQSLEIVVAEAFLQARDQSGGLLDVDFDIVRVCHVALREANAANYATIRDAVMHIAAINSIDISAPATKPARLAAESEYVAIMRRIGRLLRGYRRIDCAPLNATTIHDACRIAADRLDGRHTA